MLRRFTALLVLLLVAAPVAAQQITPLSSKPASPEPIHISDQLLKQPASQQALDRHMRKKQQGRLPSAKAAPDYEVGDTRAFRVRNIEQSTPTNTVYDDIEFTLKREEPRYYLWVQSSKLDTVRARDLDSLNTALGHRTPSGSVDPSQGIIANDEDIFGDPPNVDGDDRTDILLVDIIDGYDPPESPGFVAGFVDPVDLDPDRQANGRDVLYLDVFPGLYTVSNGEVDYRGARSASSTAAHEYQHLIMLNYDDNENSFTNEGLSEYAELVNGYPPRPPTYLGDPTEYNTSLLGWNGRLVDYQRAGLFTAYLGERLGDTFMEEAQATGAITRDPTNGLASYRNALEQTSFTLSETMSGFHTANFLNDLSVDPLFGYRRPGYEGVRANPSRVVDGRTSTGTDPTNDTVQAGGVRYLTWNRVENFRLTLEAVSGSAKARITPRALLFDSTGTVTERTVSFGETSFSGAYDRIAIMLANTEPGSGGAIVRYSAQWDAEQQYVKRQQTYDNGQVANSPGFFLIRQDEVLTRFSNPAPEDAFLAGAQLPLYFFSQFGNDDAPPPGAPRDFTLVIRGVTESGAPTDTTLFTLTRDDSRSYSAVGAGETSLRFLDLDLSEFAGQLGDLPEQIYVGYRNAGGDDNYIVLPPSIHTQENRSYIGEPGDWRKLWNIELSNGSTLQDRIVPIRATFLIPLRPPTVALEGTSFSAQRVRTVDAAQSDDGVTITWTTRTESNLERIVVERSTDGGESFTPVATVPSAGPNTSYSVTDNLFSLDQSAPQLTYRLRFVSPEGAETISEQTASVSFARLVLHGNSPNPFGQRTTILYELPAKQDVTLTVYNALGQRVAVLVNEEQETGLHRVPFEPSRRLAAGAYFFMLKTEEGTRTGEMVHVR